MCVPEAVRERASGRGGRQAVCEPDGRKQDAQIVAIWQHVNHILCSKQLDRDLFCWCIRARISQNIFERNSFRDKNNSRVGKGIILLNSMDSGPWKTVFPPNSAMQCVTFMQGRCLQAQHLLHPPPAANPASCPSLCVPGASQ